MSCVSLLAGLHPFLHRQMATPIMLTTKAMISSAKKAPTPLLMPDDTKGEKKMWVRRKNEPAQTQQVTAICPYQSMYYTVYVYGQIQHKSHATTNGQVVKITTDLPTVTELLLL